MRIGCVGLGRIGTSHVQTLRAVPGVSEVVVADVDGARAEGLTSPAAEGLAAVSAVPVEALLTADLDGLVVTTGSAAHGTWVRAAVDAGLPTFCEKPLATSLTEILEVAEHVRRSGVPVHVGFQRRFDAGYRAAAEAVRSGELGFVHTLRGVASDMLPPAADFIPGSGGIFRDCLVHDADVIRFVTGREVVSVYAVGGTKGADFFPAAGDVDTGAALLTLDDGTIVMLSTSRYNGQGQDVRLEVHGEHGTVAVGLDDSLALRSVEPGASQPAGPVHTDFYSRFRPAFADELAGFVAMVGGSPSPCTVDDALEASRVVEACDLSRREGRPVLMSEIPSALPAPATS